MPSTFLRKSGLFLSLGFAIAAQADAAVTIAKDGRALAQIYVGDDWQVEAAVPSALRTMSLEQRARHDQDLARSRAVADLRYHLKQMTGADFEVVVVDTPEAVQAPALVFGELAVAMGATPEHQTQTGDAFRLIVREEAGQAGQGGLILFGGESEVAASHAVYRFLHELGCRWIMPGPNGEVIPLLSTLTVEPSDLARAPTFEVRAPWYSGGPRIVTTEELDQFAQWRRRMGQTHGQPSHPDFMHGGHAWAYMINRYKQEFEAEPSMFAQVRSAEGGFERSRFQLEPTHPGVIDLTVRYIREEFDRHGWPKDKHVALSIGPNDGAGYSQSPETYRVSAGRTDPVTGGSDETDVLIHYANEVFERVADEFPNLRLGFYIYSVHGDYPKRYQPHPHFVAHFADITYSRHHSIFDPQSFTRTYYRSILEQWAQLAQTQDNPMWYYGYNWNLAENMFPYTRVRHFGEELPYYARIGVLGHNNEQDKAWSILGPHNYILARLGWDTTLDWRDLLREYCDVAFGAGADAMFRYYLMLDETQSHAGIESGAYPSVPLVLDRAFLSRAEALLAEARSAAETDTHRRNVEWFGQSVTALTIYHDLIDALSEGAFSEAGDRYDDLMAHWRTQLDADPNLVSRYAELYLKHWCLKPFLDLARTYSSDPYAVLHQLPEALPTRLDPDNAGQRMGFQLPAQAADKYRKTRTYRSTWDAQGLGEYRDGGVWYYHTFDGVTPADGQGVGLLIGGVEDVVHVFLNGRYVGTGRGYLTPFVFDLTDDLHHEAANFLAIQVVRENPINELGLGGLLQTSFVFAGPRLESKAPAEENAPRVLPGGSRDEATQ